MKPDLIQAAQMALDHLLYLQRWHRGSVDQRTIDALIAALSAQQEPVSKQGWLHRIDMEKTAAWQQGYAQGLHRATKAQPLTDKQILDQRQWRDSGDAVYFDKVAFARACITEFCRINGIVVTND